MSIKNEVLRDEEKLISRRLSNNKVMRRRRARHHLTGLCIECSCPVVLGRKSCDRHLKLYRLKSKDTYSWQKANHICPKCNTPNEDHTKVYCLACLQRANTLACHKRALKKEKQASEHVVE